MTTSDRFALAFEEEPAFHEVLIFSLTLTLTLTLTVTLTLNLTLTLILTLTPTLTVPLSPLHLRLYIISASSPEVPHQVYSPMEVDDSVLASSGDEGCDDQKWREDGAGTGQTSTSPSPSSSTSHSLSSLPSSLLPSPFSCQMSGTALGKLKKAKKAVQNIKASN